ncbi:MAG: helicase C-terminal domain-containing protein [Eubacteriales bacterium]
MLGNFIACDLETTGLNPVSDKIIEIGLVRAVDGKIKEKFHRLVNPGLPLPVKIKRLTGLDDSDLKECRPLGEFLPEVLEFIGDSPVVGHNIKFDLSFLSAAAGRTLSNQPVDTLELARLVVSAAREYRLDSLCEMFKIGVSVRHRALEDAEAACQLFFALAERLRSLDFNLIIPLNRLLALAHSPWADFTAGLIRENLASFPDQKLNPYPYAVFSEHPDAPFRKVDAEVVREAHPLDPEQVRDFFGCGGPLEKVIQGYEHRPQQQAMAAKIASALNGEKYLLMEAGTGVGKSMAYLLPLVLWSSSCGERSVVSTHTINLQDQLWQKDVPLLAKATDTPFKAALVKGRSNYICLRRWFSTVDSNLFPEEAAFYARVLTWLAFTKTGDKNEINMYPGDNDHWQAVCGDADSCLGGRCRYQRHCFIQRARRKAEEASLIIVNHSLLFTDVQAEKRVLPAYGPLVIDEAHHLEDVATSQLGAHVAQGNVNRWLSTLGKTLARLKDKAPPSDGARWSAVLKGIMEMRLEIVETARLFFYVLGEFVLCNRTGDDKEYTRLTLRLPPGDEGWEEVAARSCVFLDIMRSFFDETAKLVEMLELWAITDEVWAGPARDLTQVLQEGRVIAGDFEFIINCSAENYVYWVEAEVSAEGSSKHTKLFAAPVDVGSLLYENFFKNQNKVVLTSATLSVNGDFGHYKERSGLCYLPEGELLEASYDSPFRYDDQALLCINREIPAPWAVPAEDYLDQLSRAISSLVSANRGRTLVLFTSHKTLRETYRRLKSPLEEEDIYILGHGIDGGRTRILEEFKRTERSVLLGASSFWEGVDVPGDSLTCVVIVKLPFWSPSVPVIEARLEHLARRERDGFRDFSVPQAVIRFKQGFGRLIRTASDRGIVVIMDRRIMDKKYGRYFLNSLPVKSHIRGDTNFIARKITEWAESGEEHSMSWQVRDK